jgi:hypothetical protein
MGVVDYFGLEFDYFGLEFGVGVGDFVVFVVGDFFWRLPLLLGSFFIVASSFL